MRLATSLLNAASPKKKNTTAKFRMQQSDRSRAPVAKFNCVLKLRLPCQKKKKKQVWARFFFFFDIATAPVTVRAPEAVPTTEKETGTAPGHTLASHCCCRRRKTYSQIV